MSERLGRELLQGDKEMLEAEVAEAGTLVAEAEGALNAMEMERDAAQKTVMQVCEERDDLQAGFDLRWKADMRAIERWRAGDPAKALTLPDHADLCVWLLEQWERADAAEVKAELAERSERERAEKAEASLEFLGPFERPAPSPSSGNWRVGRKVTLNVYCGDEPKFQCHTPEDAAEVVSLLNGAGDGLKDRDKLEADCAALREALKGRASGGCGCHTCKKMRQALESNAGAELLRRLEKADAEAAAMREALQNGLERCLKMGEPPGGFGPGTWVHRAKAALESNAGEKLLNEVTEERKLKRAVTDKYADYCIERNELLERAEKSEKRVLELEAMIDAIAEIFGDGLTKPARDWKATDWFVEARNANAKLIAMTGRAEKAEALLELVDRRLSEAGGTLDTKLQRQIVADLQTDIRQGGATALSYWREELELAKERVSELEAERDKAVETARERLEWANCGGVPSDRVCSFAPEDTHQIYGGGWKNEDGSFICEFHALIRTKEQLATEQLKTVELTAERDRLMALVAGLGATVEGA